MRRLALLLAGLWLAPTLAPAQPMGLNVDAVEVQGNRRSEIEAILSVAQTRAGAPLDKLKLRSDIKAIFRLGFYSDVRAQLSEREGRWVLTFVVEEKPSIREIRFEGNDELEEEELTDVVDLKAFGVLDRAKVNRNAEKIKALYVEKGYFLAEINWRFDPQADNTVDVVFLINEKQEIKVARITVVGNEAVSDETIKENIETREGGGMAVLSGGGTFSEEGFERDILRINQIYYDRGYIKARVGDPSVQLSADRSQIFITIPVEEAERFKNGTIDISGDFLRPKEELMDKVTMKEGAWFSSTDLRDTINNIGEIYKDEGYAYVNVVPNTMVDDDAKKVDLIIDIAQGEKVRFGRIRVVGNTRTRDKVIRRELRVYEGELYSSSGLRRSQRLVTRLGFFETVNITTHPSGDDRTMDVLVEVKEKPTGTFQVGAGFSSFESFVGQAQIAQNNLFGHGQSLSFMATLSKVRTIANVQFSDNYFLDTKVRFAINLFRFETSYQDFTRKSLGGDLTLGYPLGDDWSVAGTYTLEDVDVEQGGYNANTGGTTANLFGDGITSSLRLSLYYDTRNNRLFPSSGWFISGSVEEASEYFLSENLFTRYRSRARYYYDLGWNITLKLNSEWGLITSPERTGVPIYERFFVGGPLSVRGFRRNTLGPEIDVPDSVRPDAATAGFNIGGTEQLILNAELEFPVFQKVGIRGVVFADFGNAFQREDAWSDKFDQMRSAWGLGIRWFSPIGPLRFEWGFPLEPLPGEETSVFDFSIGNFF
ncbi:outer membrane protein assembly factor BamA [Myxococcota bacterium]|nr:outer membrane protein assembly factor BamA [Myxococcota bacterium]MBU1899769.1 outer membrane protein assembly factor BamA [Myxococcota bacterium]